MGIKWNPIKDIGKITNNVVDSITKAGNDVGAIGGRLSNFISPDGTDKNAELKKQQDNQYRNLLNNLSGEIMGEKLISDQTKAELLQGIKQSDSENLMAGNYDSYTKTMADFKSVRDGLSMSEKSRVATEKFFQASQGYKQTESLVDAVARSRNSL